MATAHSLLTIKPGVNIAYEICGSRHLGVHVPLVLVGGMTAVRQDWERLVDSLSVGRPVLIYDHRGMGDSVASPDAIAEISIEVLARDLLALIGHLRWKHVAFCGWSMGGVVLQQLLTLPYHPNNPTPLSFYPTHVFLVATRSMVLSNQGLAYKPTAGNKPRTPAERRMIAIKILEQTFDPAWLDVNRPRFEYLCRRGAAGVRSPAVIAKQQEALRTFDFAGLLHKLPRSLNVLIIHGELDQVIPFKAAQTMMDLIPSAEFVEVGEQAEGKVPTLGFGHHWYEYFDVEVWRDVMETYMTRK
ncbi:alpha/beta-hydrolase [Marasmius fiardii PR-910]|nr:alpha/beta-hydrolase [Marasmius fiardii PR-910]